MPDFIVVRTSELDPRSLALLELVKRDVVSFQVNADNHEAVCIIQRRGQEPVTVKRTWAAFRREPGYVDALLKDPSISLNRRSVLLIRAKRDAIAKAFSDEICRLSKER